MTGHEALVVAGSAFAAGLVLGYALAGGFS